MRLSRVVLASLLTLSPLAARADNLLFTFTGVDKGSFTLSSTPTPIPGSVYDAPNNTPCCSSFSTSEPGFTVFTISYGGPANANYGGFADDNNQFSGVQIFDGSVSNPTFVTMPTTGFYIYDGTDGTDEESVEYLTITATPEPSSLVLLGTGALGLAGAVRRRLRK